MEHKWDEYTDRDDSSSDPEHDFESFLRDKVAKCTTDIPASQLESLAVSNREEALSEVSHLAQDAAESSNSGSNQVVSEENPQSISIVAPVADERVSELRLATLDAAGVKTSYISATERVLQVDEEWVRIRQESYNLAIADMALEHGPMKACELIIKKIHELNRLRFLIPAQQYGLQDALAELLKSGNAADRAKLLDLDKKYKSAQKARGVVKAKKEGAKGKTKAAKATGKKSEGMKAADVLKGLGFDKAYIVGNLMERDMLDKNVGGYVAKLFEEAK